MGMFDYIKVEQILPGNTEVDTQLYQTKDLECCLYTYVITEKGHLYRESWEYEWTQADGFLGGYSSKKEGTYSREYLTDFHGDIMFYKGRFLDTNKYRDYYARFTEGILTRMWYVDIDY
jgi:hypothetical protein